jgi:hypothetical protein
LEPLGSRSPLLKIEKWFPDNNYKFRIKLVIKKAYIKTSTRIAFKPSGVKVKVTVTKNKNIVYGKKLKFSHNCSISKWECISK